MSLFDKQMVATWVILDRLFDLSLNAECAEMSTLSNPDYQQDLILGPLFEPLFFHWWRAFVGPFYSEPPERVFVLHNDGSVFALCPIVPFSSTYNTVVIDELAKDSRQLELRRDYSRAVRENASLALAWLEAVFPGLVTSANTPSQLFPGSSVVVKAHAHVPLDASLLLQGPFSTICKGAMGDENLKYLEEINGVAGQAMGLSSNIVGKDSVLAISTKDGQVKIYVLADKIQPAWDLGKEPQLTVDNKGHILAIGMLVESSSKDVVSALRNEGKVEDAAGSFIPGRLPPLLP